MNNTLTAKEWLDENSIDTFFPITSIIDPINLGYMEQYANYKNRILEDRIKEFRKQFELHAFYNDCGDNLVGLIQEEYDKHFNINKKTI